MISNHTSMKIPPALRLNFHFVPFQLKEELKKIKSSEWINHYRKSHYDGDWAIAPLRSVKGHDQIIYATPSNGQKDFYQDTSILKRCPYFQKVLSKFECHINAARLMNLKASAKILEHTDDMGDTTQREVRIHIPIQTNEQVAFYINHSLITMKEGSVWVGDFSLPHSVENNGSNDRIHLVLDCIPNPWLAKQVEQAI